MIRGRRRGGAATVRLSPATIRRLISLFALIFGAVAALLGRRRRRIDPAAARRIDFPTQTRRMGLTMTEPLRDRLRPRWLRLK